ncbi:MAG TPA: hypothetical protein VJT50_13455 [Pyrinomonadaceae bacterium]|nr:hypothetical protein [Pyrinomonadaceae bacterium]
MTRLRTALFIAFICLCAPLTGRGQSTLMNVPSTDVVSTKQVYVEMDFITNYAWERGDNAFQNYLPRTVIGVGKNIEAGVNVSFTHVPGGGEPVEIQPNAKWQFYNNEGKGIAGAAGCIGYIPVTHRTGTRSIVQCYAVGSKQFPGTYGPRFTGGGYALINARDEKTKAGAIVAYEQPVVPKVDFIVDWFSGDNRFGYVSPGLSFTMPHEGSLSLGYLMANHGRGKNALFAYYGVTF